MGAGNIQYETGKYAKAVYVKGGSGDPSTLIGTVDSVAVAPTFTVASLLGYGDDYFDSWYAYVVWDKDGAAAAPQGESQVITGYTSSTGTFAHAAFTAALVAGDKVVISLTDPNAAGDASAANQATIITDVGRQVSMMEFWGDVDNIITLTTATADVDLPSVVVADIPAGATITRVVGMIRMRALNNTNAAVNAINGANAIKVKKSTGAWGVDDVDLINITDNIWSTAASTKEGGMLIEGDNDAASEVDANATYNLRFNGNIFVDGNNLELIDVVAGLKVYFVA
jgi:hypothetical protein